MTAGLPSPADPLAVSAPVNVYFGNPLIKEAAIIVGWSGLLPGTIGVYQLQVRIPGDHIKSDGLPVTIKIGGVSSPAAGVNVPRAWVRQQRQPGPRDSPGAGIMDALLREISRSVAFGRGLS